jgi:D-glycero-D-manno-heptose 1,7-bisphosphate phosphatase
MFFRKKTFNSIPGSIDGLKLLTDAEYKLVIVTNQAGIARGYYTEEAMQALHAYMLDSLKRVSVKVDRIYFCPHHPDGAVAELPKPCDCRKPARGLILQACSELISILP